MSLNSLTHLSYSTSTRPWVLIYLVSYLALPLVFAFSPTMPLLTSPLLSYTLTHYPSVSLIPFTRASHSTPYLFSLILNTPSCLYFFTHHVPQPHHFYPLIFSLSPCQSHYPYSSLSLYSASPWVQEPHPEPQDHAGQEPHVVGREVVLPPLKGGTLQAVPRETVLLALLAAVPNHTALGARV